MKNKWMSFIAVLTMLGMLLAGCGAVPPGPDGATVTPQPRTPATATPQLPPAEKTEQAAPTTAPTATQVAEVAPSGEYTLSGFCYDAKKLGIAFPTSREEAYKTFVLACSDCTVTRPDDMHPLLKDEDGTLYGWAFQAHGGATEPVVLVTNPTLYMQNGWMHDYKLRKSYGYNVAETAIMAAGRDPGAGIPGLVKSVKVEGFTFFCAPPSDTLHAVAGNMMLAVQRNPSGTLEQLPLPK